ncbi:hypothetical protein Tco_0056327, partial [Tanacetum coccineum]
MSSNSDDIQATGSDTRPPMLDRTDYESWSQRIRLYYRGKENGLQIHQSIDQGPLPLREVSFLDQKGLVHMKISVTRRRNDTMQMSVPPILCFKDYPKISTSSSITTLKQKQTLLHPQMGPRRNTCPRA